MRIYLAFCLNLDHLEQNSSFHVVPDVYTTFPYKPQYLQFIKNLHTDIMNCIKIKLIFKTQSFPSFRTTL